jgi:hypothetical protein
MAAKAGDPIERWTAKRRVALVVSILKGEDLRGRSGPSRLLERLECVLPDALLLQTPKEPFDDPVLLGYDKLSSNSRSLLSN